MPEWLTPEAVADYHDVDAADDRLTLSTAAVKATVERRRSDLDFSDDSTVPADVVLGGILWAGIIYQARNAPSGFTGYGDETQMFDVLGSRRTEVTRLLGLRRPVTG